jgi:hypothetical protein
MHHPRSWPVIVYLFLTVAICVVAFSTFVDLMAGWPFDYYTNVPVILLAAGIALFASRIGWWILLIWDGAALAYTASRFVSGEIGLTEIGWPSWVNIVLQSLVVVILISPGMLRWVAPFRSREKAA